MHELELGTAIEAKHYHPTLPPLPVRVVAIGDSYTGGSDMNSDQGHLWWSVLNRRMNVRIHIAATGGTGYVKHVAVHPGEDFGTNTKQVRPDDQLVIFFGSLNDEQQPAAEVQARAEQDYALAKRLAPQAKLMVIGPQWMNSNVPADERANSAAVHRAAQAAGATWVDPIAEGWFADPTGLIGSDGTHPNDRGHAHLADEIEPHIQAAVRGMSG